MIQRLSSLTSQKEGMQSERERCFALLAVKGGVLHRDLALCLRDRLSGSPSEVTALGNTGVLRNRKPETSDELNRKLRARINDLEEELSQKEDFIGKMKKLQLDHQAQLIRRTSRSPEDTERIEGMRFRSQASVESVDSVRNSEIYNRSLPSSPQPLNYHRRLFYDTPTQSSVQNQQRRRTGGTRVGVAVTCTYLDLERPKAMVAPVIARTESVQRDIQRNKSLEDVITRDSDKIGLKD